MPATYIDGSRRSRLSADLAPIGGVRLGVEAAALAPTSGEPQQTFLTQPDAAERSGRPYLQGELRAGWGEGDRLGEISFGGHYGWLEDSTGGRIDSKALASALDADPGGRELLPAFVGQALAGLGGGGIGQNMVKNGVPVEAKGGWVQLNYESGAGSWELGVGSTILKMKTWLRCPGFETWRTVDT